MANRHAAVAGSPSPGRGLHRSGPAWLPVVVAGVALGGLNSLSSALGTPFGRHSLDPDNGVPALQYLAAWLGTRWAWALFAFGFGWASRSLRSAVLRASAGLWLAVVVYYVSDALLAVNDTLSVGEIGYWLVLAGVTGPVMAAVGRAARQPVGWSVAPGLLAPALMVVDTWWAPTGPDSIKPYAQWAVLGGAAALALCLAVRAILLVRAQRSAR